MARWMCALALLLGASSVAAAEEHHAWLRFDTLPPGQVVRLQTNRETYRVHLLHPQTGEARVSRSSDGERFAASQRVFLVGATMSPQAGDGGFSVVLMGEIHEGMCLEWGWGSLAPADRHTSTPLKAIILETPTTQAPQ